MTGTIAVLPTHQFSLNGEPVANGSLATYAANTVTPETTWQDKAQTVANTNPITLDAQGECTLWLDPTKIYDFVLKNSLGATIRTYEDVNGAANISVASSEWLDTGLPPTYISANSFSLVGDNTNTYHFGRRVKVVLGSSVIYGTIQNSVFSTVTTVTLSLDSGSLDISLSAVNIGEISFANSSINIDGRRGTDIAVAASGVVTLPVNADFFVITGTGFNITGFADSYNGRIVTLKPAAGLTFVHGTGFVLEAGGRNRVTMSNDIIVMINNAAGVWREVSYTYGLGVPSFSVGRSTNTANFAVAVDQIISFNLTNYDTQTEYASNKYTAKTPGVYAFTLHVQPVNVTGAQTYAYISFKKNGTLERQVYQDWAALAAPALPPMFLCADIEMAAGDYIETFIQMGGTGTYYLTPTPQYLKFTGSKLP